MSNVISINKGRINKVIDETYSFLDNITIGYYIDNYVYYDEYYLFCKSICDFMDENNIDKDFFEVIDFIISNVACDIVAKKDEFNIKNIIIYTPIYLKIKLYNLNINPINELKIVGLKAKMLKEITKLLERRDTQFKKR